LEEDSNGATSSPTQKAVVESPVEAGSQNPPQLAVPETRRAETGPVRVRYSIYDQEFPLEDGMLRFEDIDERFSISFAHKGNWVCSLSTLDDGLTDDDRLFFHPEGGALTKTVLDGKLVFTGRFLGLKLHDSVDSEGEPRQRVYELAVEEDPLLARKEKEKQMAAFAERGGAAGPLAGLGEMPIKKFRELLRMSQEALGEAAHKRLTAELKDGEMQANINERS